MMFQKTPFVAVSALLGFVLAHPGHDPTEEMMERRDFIKALGRSDLSHCAEKLEARGVVARNAARRAAAVDKARKKRGLEKRNLQDLLNTDHDRSELGYTPETDINTLFTSDSSCLLTPEVTEGPYYVGGEFIRSDVTDGEDGVPLILDYQVIDVNTCDPIPNIHLELWHCNATGVYSGVVVQGNGNAADQTNLDNTFGRGIQETDADGVAQFETVFPGHYTGRTIHNHLLVHTNAQPFPNGTLGNEVSASHIGQAYFDQDLINEVERNQVYLQNQQPLTQNANDFILAQQANTEGVDPFHEYVLLGDSVSEGLFAWLAFGISPSSSRVIQPAVNYYEEGGVKNPNAGSGFPGFPPGGWPKREAEKEKEKK